MRKLMKSKEEKRGRKPVVSIGEKIEHYTDKGKKEYNFMYGFYVNQHAVILNKWNIDIIDLGIYYCIERFIQNLSNNNKVDNEMCVEDSLGKWYFVSEYKIIKDMPLLPLSSKNAVYKRIANLVECGLIERNPNNTSTRLKLIRLGSNSHLLNTSNINKTSK